MAICMKIFVPILILAYLLATVHARYRLPKKQPAKTEKKKAPQINTDLLPQLKDVFNDLQLNEYIPKFVKMGVTETRNLLRLTDMDFHIMMYDWEGMTSERVELLKKKIKEIEESAVLVEKTRREDIEERKKLKYGRLYLQGAVQSFEYLPASFGADSPMGSLPITIASGEGFGCEVNGESEIDLSGLAWVVRRGECSFLQKAQSARAANASLLIIVNSEDRLESASSGLGLINSNVTQEQVDSVSSLPIILVSNTTLSKFKYSVSLLGAQRPMVDVVPLKCLTTGGCVPVTPEDQRVATEISWGTLYLHKSGEKKPKPFEFLASVFGGVMPRGDHLTRIVFAEPIDGCSALTNPPESLQGAMVVFHRGECPFVDKALHAQSAGARLVAVVDPLDRPLQRIGSQGSQGTFVGVPSILLTAPAGEFMRNHMVSGSGGVVDLTAEIDLGDGISAAEDWIDIAEIEWNESPDEQLMQIEGLIQKYSQNHHFDVIQWLQRKSEEIKRQNRNEL